jgi:hypothetical protein
MIFGAIVQRFVSRRVVASSRETPAPAKCPVVRPVSTAALSPAWRAAGRTPPAG